MSSESQPTRTDSGCSALPEPLQEAGEADERIRGADRLRQRVVGAVGERVAVDREQQAAHSDASSAWIAAIRRSVASRAASATLDGRAGRRARSARRSARASRSSRRRPSVPLMPAGTSGTPGLEGDPRRAGVRPASNVLRRPFRRRVPSGNIATTLPSRASRTAVSIASLSALAAVHLEGAGRRSRSAAEREPEELRLRHEAQEAPRPDRQADRPGIEIREVAGGEHVAARGGQMLDSVGPVAEGEPQDRPGKHGDQGVEQRRPGRTCHRRRVSLIRRAALWWRAKWPRANGKKLVIVESPAKAKTIAGYLGNDYIVESSIGHIRDLPNNAAEIPAALKGEAWARLGVDVDNDFEPLYVVDSRKKKVVSDLKAKLKDADELLLATDEDREGEAIAWHLRRGAEAEGAGAAHGVPRDHQARDRAGARRDARDRRAARRRAGDAAHPRPPLRLRGLARALAQGHAGPLRGTRAVGRDAARRRARARADGVRRRRLLGHRRDARRRAGSTARLTAVDGQTRRAGPRLRPDGEAAPRRRRPARRGRGARARRRSRRRGVHGRARSRRSRTPAARPRRS